MSAGAKQSLGTRTLRGMFWSYGSYVGTRGATLLATAILTRLLDPKDFGLVALAGTFMTFLDMLQGLGVGNALVVVKEEEVEAQAETAFAVRWSSARYYPADRGDRPAGGVIVRRAAGLHVMPALADVLLLRLGSTHDALATKRTNFPYDHCRARRRFRPRRYPRRARDRWRGRVESVIAYAARNIAMDMILWRLIHGGRDCVRSASTCDTC